MQMFSLAVAKIELLYDGPDVAVVAALGTGFFYGHDSQAYLVTNWHNVTGLHPETGRCLHSKGLIPNVLRLHYKEWHDKEKTLVRSQQVDLPLYIDDKATWFEHSSRAAVDGVALPIAKPAEWANVYINDINQEQRLEAEAGMDCFILGFPEGLSGAALTPFWKRGAIAAEPYLQQPYLIDSATRRGMSGSPVVIRHNGYLGFGGGTMTGADVIGTSERFVAIYSGRIGDDELGGQLGRAWQANVLTDILTQATSGRHPLRNQSAAEASGQVRVESRRSVRFTSESARDSALEQ